MVLRQQVRSSGPHAFLPGTRETMGAREGLAMGRPRNTPLQSPPFLSLRHARTCDRRALWAQSRRPPRPHPAEPVGATPWPKAPGSASVALRRALPGADDPFSCGLVPACSGVRVFRVHQASPAPHGHVHLDLEKASSTRAEQVSGDGRSPHPAHPTPRGGTDSGSFWKLCVR